MDAAHLLKKGSPIIKNIGQFYRESLKAELVKAGFELRDVDKSKSFYELKNVSDDLIQSFSSRNIAIKAKVEELKKEYPNMSKSQLSLRAFFNTRVSKKEVDRDEVRAKNAELISKHVNIDELKKLISIVKSEISNKKHRTTLNVATQVAAKIDTPISISTLYNQIKNEEVKERKQLQTMHEVLINALQSTKLDTEKLFSSLKHIDKHHIEEVLENGKTRTPSERDRFIASFSSITGELERAKQSHNNYVGDLTTTTAERGVGRGELERYDDVNAKSAGINYPSFTAEQMAEYNRRGNEAIAKERAEKTQKGEIER